MAVLEDDPTADFDGLVDGGFGDGTLALAQGNHEEIFRWDLRVSSEALKNYLLF